MLVKLQRPPPEIAIFLPTRSECSKTKTLRPRLPASIAQNRPAAPPPMTMTSRSDPVTCKRDTKLETAAIVLNVPAESKVLCKPNQMQRAKTLTRVVPNWPLDAG